MENVQSCNSRRLACSGLYWCLFKYAKEYFQLHGKAPIIPQLWDFYEKNSFTYGAKYAESKIYKVYNYWQVEAKVRTNKKAIAPLVEAFAANGWKLTVNPSGSILTEPLEGNPRTFFLACDVTHLLRKLEDRK